MLGLWFRSVAQGGLGVHEAPGEVTPVRRPAEPFEALASAAAPGTGAAHRSAPARQILFGDLHVHTTYSFDAFMLSLPLAGGEGAHPPADACDFARFCSALDFWSINDHAESISPTHWAETVESIRACNAVGGEGETPDTVAFLGWEWTQVGATPAEHYGHKNVVLRDLDEASVPARPIGARGARARIAAGDPFGSLSSGIFLHGLGEPRMHDLARFFDERRDLETCPLGVAVRDLPSDCMELVDTPDLLFEKLDDWGSESIVIPHGTTWGFYTPPGSDWAKQPAGPLHDDDRQTLLEIYSGHGNAEEFRPFEAVRFDANGKAVCPEPTAGYLPTCWRAGEIIEARCLAAGESAPTCAARAVVARANAVRAGGQAHLTVPGTQAAEWLDAGQCRDCTQPAFNYRPGGAAQYILALSNFDTPDRAPRRFRFGLMASSDNHFGRPGTGYKEVHRAGFSESRNDVANVTPMLRNTLAPPPRPRRRIPRLRRPRSQPFRLRVDGDGRQASYFMTGGLVAVHAEGRSRDAIWEALQRREVYGTSGPRILLWFDLLGGAADRRSASRWAARSGRIRTRSSRSAPSAPSSRPPDVPTMRRRPSAPTGSRTSAKASATTRRPSGDRSRASTSSGSAHRTRPASRSRR